MSVPTYYQFCSGVSLRVFDYRLMNMQYFVDKLSKMLNSNINKHHQKTIDFLTFIVCDMVKTSSWDYIFFQLYIV